VCAEIIITISGVQFTPAVENFTIPAVTKHICWYKPVGTEQADASVAISTKNICDVAADNKTSENDNAFSDACSSCRPVGLRMAELLAHPTQSCWHVHRLHIAAGYSAAGSAKPCASVSAHCGH
jgi:hypothetical protein